MSNQLTVPESLHNELSRIIFTLSTKGYSVSYEFRNYSPYGSVSSFVMGGGVNIKLDESEAFDIDGEVDYRPSIKDIENYRDKLKALLATTSEEEAA